MSYTVTHSPDPDTHETLGAGMTEAEARAMCSAHEAPYDLYVTLYDEYDLGPMGLPEIVGQINGEEFAADPASISRTY